MTKKTIEENLEDKTKEEIEIEESESENVKIRDVETKEVKTEEIIKKEPVLKGTPFIVYRNEGEKLFLIDSKGNGFKISTPEQYKNSKKDDIIYI